MRESDNFVFLVFFLSSSNRTPPSPENNSNLDRDDEVPIEIDSQSVEQLNVVVEVDVNVMGGSDDEEESDVGPIVNDEFVAADASQRHQYTEGRPNNAIFVHFYFVSFSYYVVWLHFENSIDFF